MSRPAKKRRRPLIDPRPRRIRADQREWPHVVPLRAKIILLCTRGKTILVHRVDDIKPLPVVDIHDGATRKEMAVEILTSGAIVKPGPIGGQREVDIDISERVTDGI